MVRKLQNSSLFKFQKLKTESSASCVVWSFDSFPPAAVLLKSVPVFWFYNPSVPHCRGCYLDPRLLHNHPPDSSSRELKVSRCKETLFFHHSWCLRIFVYFWPLLLTLKLLCSSLMTSLDMFDDVRSNTVDVLKVIEFTYILSVAVWCNTLYIAIFNLDFIRVKGVFAWGTDRNILPPPRSPTVAASYRKDHLFHKSAAWCIHSGAKMEFGRAAPTQPHIQRTFGVISVVLGPTGPTGPSLRPGISQQTSRHGAYTLI